MQRLPCTAAKVSKTLLYLLHKGWLCKFYLVRIFSMGSLVFDFPAASASASAGCSGHASFSGCSHQPPNIQSSSTVRIPANQFLTLCIIQKEPRAILNNNFQGKHAPQLLLTPSIWFYFQGVLTRLSTHTATTVRVLVSTYR